jgi:hypothetical protein
MKDDEARVRRRQWQAEQARKILRLIQAGEMGSPTQAEIDALTADIRDDRDSIARKPH